MMGVRLTNLPKYLDKWCPGEWRAYPDWDTRSRGSGDFVDVMGVGIHHTASGLLWSADREVEFIAEDHPDSPVGNGLLTREKDGPIFILTSVRATNTQGRGGPVLSSRGVIPLDSGNSRLFSIEAANNGLGEPWPDDVYDLYLRVCIAVIECANDTQSGADLGVGDIWAHFEWTNPLNPYGITRKPDPFGPSKANGYINTKWQMNNYRGHVLERWLKGPPGTTPPVSEIPVQNPEEEDMLLRQLITCHLSDTRRSPYMAAWNNGTKTIIPSASLVDWRRYMSQIGATPAQLQAVNITEAQCRAFGPIQGFSGGLAQDRFDIYGVPT